MPPRLKSLELHGYKTFASRIEFQFPGMITAIVGPNGSGKSNIADAIRWVLGEQSYSLLRGRKTEDMIFAGSEQRARAGMASATITFDNEDSWLPIDFDEVSITRRAYRDGNNEYLLNGQRVRLREISELLAQSGLAERTYTVIGQGLVDAALALKPEERRRLFEEAAGIGLYRSRREDALNRLEMTRRNLERVQDILAELEPRLRSLERQAKRVQDYERLRSDLQALLRDWYGYHWHKAQQEFNHSREVLQAQETRFEQAGQRYDEVHQEVLALRSQMGEIRSGLNDWHAQSADLHRLKEQISREMAVTQERQRSIQEQMQGRKSDIAHLEDELQSMQARIESAAEEQNRLSLELEEAQKQALEAAAELGLHQEQRKTAEKALQEVRSRMVGNETRLVKLKAHLDELSGRLESQNRSLENSTKVSQVAKRDLEKARLAEELTIKARKEEEEKRRILTQELQKCRQATTRLEGDRKVLQDQQNKLEAERVKLQVQLDALYQADKSLMGLSEGARALLRATGNGKEAQYYTALSSMLDIPQEYEIAISAALGEFVNVLLLHKGSDLEKSMEMLEVGEKGRAALLPLEWADPEPIHPPQKNGELIGIASELIHVPEEIRHGINTLLGRTLIVADRKVARRLLQESDNFNQVVTLKGEVFHRAGAVIAGREPRNSLLSRPRQKRELHERITSLDKQAESLSEQLNQLAAQITQARKDESVLDSSTRNAVNQYDRAAEAAQNSHYAFQQASRQLEWHTQQLGTLEGQIVKTQKEISGCTNEITTLESRLGIERESVREAITIVNGFPLDEFQAQVNHWNTQAAVTGRALKDAQTRIGELQQGQETNQRRLAELGSLLSSFEENQKQLSSREAGLQEREYDLEHKLEDLRTKIDPAESELHRLETEYNQLEDAETIAQQALTVAERYQTQAQLDLTRQRESVENIRRRIEEDFGLVSLEYEENVAGPAPLPLEGMVEQLPLVPAVPSDLETNISRLRAQIRRLGPINTEAQVEYLSVLERYQFLTGQVTDLHKADGDLRQIITELDDLMRREFRKTFEAVAEEFKGMFTRLFSGGSARLILVEGETPADTGIEIETRLPGRREQGLSLLSGGERSLTAVALVFSLLKISPTPFCIMDEVDAMLDEANVSRFRDLLRELSQSTQFIVITHNRNTVQAADVIYGVTMGRDSSSQVISLRMDQVSSELAE